MIEFLTEHLVISLYLVSAALIGGTWKFMGRFNVEG